MSLEIDWPHLLELELWDLEEAICFAHRLHAFDYPTMSVNSDGEVDWLVEGRDPSVGNKIIKRYAVAISAIEAGTLPSRSQTESRKPRVNPREFAKWASGKGWDLPEQLESLVPEMKTGTASLENPKHRKSWQNLLGALCMKANINYREPGADAKLANLTERYGVQVGRKTIKTIIDELSDHVPWRVPPRS